MLKRVIKLTAAEITSIEEKLAVSDDPKNQSDTNMTGIVHIKR